MSMQKRKPIPVEASYSRFDDQQLRSFLERVIGISSDIRAQLALGQKILEKRKTHEEIAQSSRELRQRIVHSHEINEEHIVKLMATHRPLETDFRLLVSALKISNDLNRMGNQSSNVVGGFLRLKNSPEPRFKELFCQMIEAVDLMIRNALVAFSSINQELAELVVAQDDNIDAMNLSLIHALVKRTEEAPEEADSCITQVLITRNLERIGDLCTNIADEVISYAKGCMI